MSVIRLEIMCAHCGKLYTTDIYEPQETDTLGAVLNRTLKRPWVVQNNGQLDTYCCKVCAK